MATINDGKDTAQAWRPVLFAQFTFPDASVLRVSSHNADSANGGYAFGGYDWLPRISDQEIDRLAHLTEQGVDRIPSATVHLADPDAWIWTNYERASGKGFKGAELRLIFALHDPVAGTYTTDSLIPFVGLCDQPAIDEKTLTVSAQAKLNLTRYLVPNVPIQKRCPLVNPATAAQRALAADPESQFYFCGETRAVGTASPCSYTKATCTQPNRFLGVTWEPGEKTGAGKEYISGGKVSWSNVDTSGKYREYWPLWLGGAAWMECRALNVVGDGNYTRGEIAVGFGAVDVQRVILNGVELSYGTSGDYRWHYVNDGDRDGTPNSDAPYNSEGDPYGNASVIQVLAPRAVWTPENEPSVKILGRRKTLRVYRRIATAVGSGSNIVVTFDSANEDCAGNSPFTVTVVGNSWAGANGTHGLTNWTYGPPGTITLATTGTGSGTGGYCYYEVSGIIPGGIGQGASTPWPLLELLHAARFDYAEVDGCSFADVAKICKQAISYTDQNGSSQTQPRFSTAVALRQRRSAAELVRGIRQSIGALLVPDSNGTLKLQIEGPLAEQQPAAVDGSNYVTAISSTTRAGVTTNGYAAYRFDDDNSWGLKRIARPMSELPNRVEFAFQDPANGYATSTFAMVDSDDQERAGEELSGGLAVDPEGIATYNHASRCARLGLAKLHRGNPGGDTRGTDWLEWQSSFRGCKLAIGQIVLVNNSRLGYTNQQVRITSIKPAKNFETVTFQGHYHNDAWYLDTAVDSTDPAYSAKGRDRLPRPAFAWRPDSAVPVSGDSLGAQRGFGLEPVYEDLADGGQGIRLKLTGKLPVNEFCGLSSPGIGVQATIATTGGTIAGDQVLYIAVVALDSAGKPSAPSSSRSKADVPSGTNTNTVTVPVYSWDPDTSGYAIYAGSNPNDLTWQANGSGKPSSVTLTALTTDRYGLPDVEFDSLLIRVKRIRHSGVWGDVADAVGTNTIQTLSAGWTTNEWAGYDVSALAIADGSATPIASFRVTSNTADTLTVTPDPNALLDAGDVIVMRSVPTVGSDSSGNYLEDQKWLNSLSNDGDGLEVNAEKSALIRFLAGPAAGQTYVIRSNTDRRIYIEGDWFTTPTSASRYIIEESAWQFSKKDGPYNNSDAALETSILVDATPWKNQAILVQAIALDGGEALGFESLAPIREHYILSSLSPDIPVVGYAPNQTPVTGGAGCRVNYVARGNRAMYQFVVVLSVDTDVANYANTLGYDVSVFQPANPDIRRFLGGLTAPAAGTGVVQVNGYTDEWDLPVGADETWTMEFVAVNLNGVATADPPTVTGLTVHHTTTSGGANITIAPVTSFTVVDYGMDATQEFRLFSAQWYMPSDMSNVSAVKIRVATPDLPGGQDVTGHLFFPASTAGLGAFTELVRINRADLPSSSETWTWKCVSINAAGDGDNVATAPTSSMSVGPSDGSVPDLLPPLPPTSISCADTGVRVMVGANETFTTLRATIVLPTGHRASKIWLWFSDNGGTTWGVVTTAWAAALSTFDFIERVPATAASNWKVKATTASEQCVNAESTAVVSAAFSVGTLAAPGAGLITDGAVGTYTYVQDADGSQSWGLSYVQWTNPSATAYPEFYHSQLTVQKVDASGNAAPDYEGIERIVDQDTDPGVLRSKPVDLWTLPSSATYKYFRLRLYVLNRNLDRILQTTAWSGAAYIAVSPTDPGGALQLNRAATSTLGPNLSIGAQTSGGTPLLNLANTNVSNILPNADFQTTSPSSSSWADKWTAVNAATRQTTGMETGQYLMRLGYNASGSAIVSERLRVSKGARYAASVRAKADSGPGGSLVIAFRFYTPSGTWLSSSDASYTRSTVSTSWETIGYAADVPIGVDAYWVEVRISATPSSGKYYYIDRAEMTLVTVQTVDYDSSSTTAVKIGQHLNASSQFVGLAAIRSNGWRTEQQDWGFFSFAPSGRSLTGLWSNDAATDYGQMRVSSDNASGDGAIQATAGDQPVLSVIFNQTNSKVIQLTFNPSTGEAQLWMNGVLKLSQA